MKRTTVALLAAAQLTAAAAFAPASAQQTVAGWDVGPNDNGVCVMVSSYTLEGRPDVESYLGFAITDGGTVLQIMPARSDWNLPEGGNYEVQVAVDRLWTGRGTARALGRTAFAIVLPVSEELLTAIVQGDELGIRTARGTYTYTLNGTERAMPELARCVVETEGGQAGTPPSNAGDREPMMDANNPFAGEDENPF